MNISFADIGIWCNGNTTDSGPVIPGSSPGIPTSLTLDVLIEFIGIWCNGNTTDSGPVIPGSSPGIPTSLTLDVLIEFIGIWCNGNTTDSGPVIPGSSPGIPTHTVRHLSVMKGVFLFIGILFYGVFIAINPRAFALGFIVFISSRHQ